MSRKRVSASGKRMYLWRAVDPEGEVLDMLVQSRRDGWAEPSVARARERIATAGLRQRAEAIVADASAHPFTPDSFELAFSRFGIMFFSDPMAAFENVRRDEAGRAIGAGSVPRSKRDAMAERPTRSSPPLATPDPDARARGPRPILMGRSSALAPRSQPRQFAVTIAVRSWWISSLRKGRSH